MKDALPLLLLAGLLTAGACGAAEPAATDARIVFRCATEKAEFRLIAKIREWGIQAGYTEELLGVIDADSRSPERVSSLFRSKDRKIEIMISPAAVFSGILGVYISNKKEGDQTELKRELARFLAVFPKASVEKTGQPAATAQRP